jgi:hypothetical protein
LAEELSVVAESLVVTLQLVAEPLVPVDLVLYHVLDLPVPEVAELVVLLLLIPDVGLLVVASSTINDGNWYTNLSSGNEWSI